MESKSFVLPESDLPHRWYNTLTDMPASLDLALDRAQNLEKYLQTPAKMRFKNEGVCPAGSHKPGTAVAQAYWNKISGTKRITNETGAGEWKSASGDAAWAR